MPKTLEDTEGVKEFVLKEAGAATLRNNGYNQVNRGYETAESLEVYSCDAGCKNCHCAGY
ncbi:MAG: hypothetical protein HQ541_15410 [Mariniphaga sp.]|nr:hypothetical protein [Mariniphaga sp.]